MHNFGLHESEEVKEEEILYNVNTNIIIQYQKEDFEFDKICIILVDIISYMF